MNVLKITSKTIFYKSYKAVDSQIHHNSSREKVYCQTLILLQSFYCVKWNIFLAGYVYLIIDTYYFLIIPISERAHEWTDIS